MTSRQPPSVAVVIPCYNGAKVLARTIESLLTQNWPVDEILVVDDGSTDNSIKVAESFGARVRIFCQKNFGAAVARYRGVCEAASDIIIFNDCGDLSSSNRVGNLINALCAHPECVASFSAARIMNRPDPSISRITQQPFDGSQQIIDDALNRMLIHPAPLAACMNLAIRRSVALQSTKIDPFYRVANDYALQLSTARHGPWVYVSEISMEYEIMDGGLSLTTGWTMQKCYALCAAVETFDQVRGTVSIDEPALKQRIEQTWPTFVLYMLLKKQYAPMRRVISAGFRLGRLSVAPRALWWGLYRADEQGDLNGMPLLRWLVRSIKRVYRGRDEVTF